MLKFYLPYLPLSHLLYLCNVIIKILNVMEIVNSDIRVYGGVEYTSVTEYTSNGFVYHLSY